MPHTFSKVGLLNIPGAILDLNMKHLEKKGSSHYLQTTF